MKKRFLLTVVFLLAVFVCGCNRVTIDDARAVADKEKSKIAMNLRVYNEQREQERKEKREKKNNQTNKNELNTLNQELSSEDIDKITVKGLGDVVEFTPFECSFLDVKVTSNINDVGNMTEQDIAEAVVKDVIDGYGPDSKTAKLNGTIVVDADGEINKDIFESFLLIRIKVKNIGDNPRKMHISPGFYKAGDTGKFVPCTSSFSEITIGNTQRSGTDKFYYEFKPKEEQEFVLTYAINSISDYYNIYLDTRFLRDLEDIDSKVIPDGSIFVKI